MSNLTQQAGRKKIVHHLDTPFSAVSWPEISLEDQDTILELLCDLLSPLGHHRQAHAKRSKGKRAARRQNEANKTGLAAHEVPVPPQPQIATGIDIGFNSITRNLQSSAVDGNQKSDDAPSRYYSMIFVARGNQSATFNCHFPQMVAAASKDLPTERKICLVGISKPCSERLSTCLGLPRVSAVAILKDAADAGALHDFVKKVVSPVDATWLETSRQPPYLTTNIKSIETTIGNKRTRIG
ncbi:Fc.00g076610.m01.CDS01 [Cosmosporella sp. VM-42]